MSEAERAEIIRQWYGGGSFRGIARALGMNRKTVAAVIKAHKDNVLSPISAYPHPLRSERVFSTCAFYLFIRAHQT